MAGIDFLKRNKVLVTSRSLNLIRENRYYQWKQDKNGKFINVPMDWQNHILDSCRYSYSLVDFNEKNKDSVFVDYKDL